MYFYDLENKLKIVLRYLFLYCAVLRTEHKKKHNRNPRIKQKSRKRKKIK